MLASVKTMRSILIRLSDTIYSKCEKFFNKDRMLTCKVKILLLLNGMDWVNAFQFLNVPSQILLSVSSSFNYYLYYSLI